MIRFPGLTDPSRLSHAPRPRANTPPARTDLKDAPDLAARYAEQRNDVYNPLATTYQPRQDSAYDANGNYRGPPAPDGLYRSDDRRGDSAMPG